MVGDPLEKFPTSSLDSIPGCSLFLGACESPVNAAILSLAGEVDFGNAPRIYSLMWKMSEKGSKSLIVNLEKLEFMDSSGLQLMLRLREKLRNEKRDILLVNPNPQIKKLFQLTGFDHLFHFFDNNSQAEAFLEIREKSSGEMASK